jgi:predicted DNA-binding transcriptional regulator AlpA
MTLAIIARVDMSYQRNSTSPNRAGLANLEAQFEKAPPNRLQPLLLTRKDLKSLGIPYSNAHLLRLEAVGKFCKRLRLSPRGRAAWLYEDVIGWIDARAAERSRRDTGGK